MIAVLLALTGCWGDRSAAKVVADELCRWGQLEELTPSILPPTVDLAKLVRDLDLKYASGEPPNGASTQNPFLALHQTLGLVVDDPAKAYAEAQAARTVCEVTVTVTGETAKAKVVRKVSRPLDGVDAFTRAGEVQRLATHQERVAEIERWFEAAPPGEPKEYDLLLEEHGGEWIANLSLPESSLARAQAELVTVEQTIATAEAAHAALQKVVVVEAKWFNRASKRSSAKRVDITVRNDLDVRVTRVDFHGTLTHPGRDTPWVDEELSYTVRGKMEPGDQETFTFVSRLPNKWRVNAPEDSTLTIEVIRMAGPGGEVLYTLDGWEEAVARKQILDEEIARLKQTYGV